MANEEHVAILKRGVKAWNRWREQNREVEPDLREAPFAKGAQGKQDGGEKVASQQRQ